MPMQIFKLGGTSSERVPGCHSCGHPGSPGSAPGAEWSRHLRSQPIPAETPLVEQALHGQLFHSLDERPCRTAATGGERLSSCGRTGQPTQRVKIETRHLNFFLRSVTGPVRHLDADSREVGTALIGPSGCGKSTFLRTLNRMNDIVEGARHTGISFSKGSTLTARRSTSSHSGSGSEWCSRSRLPSPSRSSRTWPSDHA